MSFSDKVVNIAADRQKTRHLRFLDGTRGIAALYVALGHAVWIASGFTSPPGRSHYVLQPLLYGQVAVAVFIVLSGYCLALPCVRGGLLRSFDWKEFCRRRAWRILPPYFVALVLAIVSEWTIARLLPGASQSLTTGSIVSHLLLAHDLRPEWSHAINAPMWSVAVEWHIYFVFAFLLVPIWRSVGIALVVVLSASFSVILHCLPEWLSFDWVHPWYVVCFALGMSAAAVTEMPDFPRTLQLLRRRSTTLIFLSAVLLAGLYAFKTRLGNNLLILSDTLEGLIAALFIVRLENASSAGHASPLRGVLESRLALALGAMSYSLYLFHWPVLTLLNATLKQAFDPEFRCWLLLFVGCPIAVAVAFAAYLTIERPSIARRCRRPVPSEVRGSSQPASAKPAVMVQP